MACLVFNCKSQCIFLSDMYSMPGLFILSTFLHFQWERLKYFKMWEWLKTHLFQQRNNEMNLITTWTHVSKGRLEIDAECQVKSLLPSPACVIHTDWQIHILKDPPVSQLKNCATFKVGADHMPLSKSARIHFQPVKCFKFPCTIIPNAFFFFKLPPADEYSFLTLLYP